MFRFLASAGALALMASSSLSAEVAPAVDWTGVSIGLNGNWNFLSTDVSSPPQTYGPHSFSSQDHGNLSGNGIGGGIQLGFDYQLGDVVLGIQAITSVTAVDSSHSVDSQTFSAELTSYGSLNARLGYLIQPELLAYAKGGLAFGSFTYEDKSSRYGYSGSKDGEHHQGWMVGGGVEWLFAPNWSVFAEYDWSDFGTQTVELSYRNADWGDKFKYEYQQSIGSAVLGVNYRF